METSIDETLGRTAVALPSRRASKDERAGREVQKPPYNMAAVGLGIICGVEEGCDNRHAVGRHLPNLRRWEGHADREIGPVD